MTITTKQMRPNGMAGSENRSAKDNTAPPRRLQVHAGSLLTSVKLPKAPISHLAEILGGPENPDSSFIRDEDMAHFLSKDN